MLVDEKRCDEQPSIGGPFDTIPDVKGNSTLARFCEPIFEIGSEFIPIVFSKIQRLVWLGLFLFFC